MASLDNAQMSHLVDASFGEVDLFCEAVKSWDLDFSPLRRAMAGGPVARIAQSRFGGIEFAHARLAVSLDQAGMPPSGKLTFIVLEDSMRRLWWRRHDVDRDTVLVFPVGSDDLDATVLLLLEND